MNICLFCGSSAGNNTAYTQAAQSMARAIAQRGWHIFYGGGSTGLMGVVADAALAAGGQITGIAPHMLLERELTHRGLSTLHLVETTSERKAMMLAQSDAFVALPGGLGTLDEICEVLTLAQLGTHRKPCALLNINGYFDGFISQLDHGVQQGFIREAQRRMLRVGNDPEALLDVLFAAVDSGK